MTHVLQLLKPWGISEIGELLAEVEDGVAELLIAQGIAREIAKMGGGPARSKPTARSSKPAAGAD